MTQTETEALKNEVRPLSFSGPRVHAELVLNAQSYFVSGPAIVINPSASQARVSKDPAHGITAMSSTFLVDASIEHANSLIIVRPVDDTSIDGIITEPGWQHYSEIDPSFPRNSPLWRSDREGVGAVTFDPADFLRASQPFGPVSFDVSVNLWYAPPETSCLVHNSHQFIEVHTQVTGTGHMQKFKSSSNNTLYEDQLMTPGFTAAPFCGTGEDLIFSYPWHQYYADTACVWMAIEYHPQETAPDSEKVQA